MFICGPIGSGKTFLRHYMTIQGYLPVDAPIIINMDDIRLMLPESNILKEKEPWTWGANSQQESGLIAELISFVAISLGRSIIVDGTMKDISWNKQYIKSMKSLAPDRNEFNVGVIHVTAKPEIIFKRVNSRNMEGISNPFCSKTRVVPMECVTESLKLMDVTYLNEIKSHLDIIISIDNSVENRPVLVHPWYLSWDGFKSMVLSGCHFPQDEIEDEACSDATYSEISDLTETNCSATSSDSDKSTNSLIITKTAPTTEAGIVDKIRLSISTDSGDSNATDLSCVTCSLDGLPYCTEEKKTGNIAERILKRFGLTTASKSSKEKSSKEKRHSLPAITRPPNVAEPKPSLKKCNMEELPAATEEGVKLSLVHPDDIRSDEYRMPQLTSKSIHSVLSAEKRVDKGNARMQRSSFCSFDELVPRNYR